MTQHGVTRRGLFKLAAGAAGVGALSALTAAGVTAKTMPKATWRGVALGGEASMTLVHWDGEKARQSLDMAVAELQRLEKIFSIYDPDSYLSRLNRDKYLKSPPLELVALLSQADQVHRATDGYFDLTVQPLWHRKIGAHAGSLPTMVDQKRIRFSAEEINLAGDQEVTLNGIAQGAITDALTGLLTNMGFGDLLLDTGEVMAMGESPDGDPWQVAIGNEKGTRVNLIGQAMATSAPDRVKAHLFDPHTGQNGSLFQSVSVVTKRATLADGLSTALAVMPEQRWTEVLGRFKAVHIQTYGRRLDGTDFELSTKKPA